LWGDFREKLKIARTSQKSHLVKTSYTAVNEKGEFAGNVQFVAGCARMQGLRKRSGCDEFLLT
jgi:hypothetical protein